MKQKIVIYESPQNLDRLRISLDLWRGRKIYVVEPVFAFHYRSRSHFYPRHLPAFVKDLIAQRKIELLTCEQLKSKEIFFDAGDDAVKHVEAVFKELYKEHSGLIQYTTETLCSPKAENAFKTNLAHRLSEFFSMNILLRRISDRLGTERFSFHPRMNICSYRHIKKLVEQSKIQIFEHPDVDFPWRYFCSGIFENLKAKILILSKILVQTIGAAACPSQPIIAQEDQHPYLLGVAIVAPRRQLVGNKRGPDFLADQKNIKSEDIVYFIQRELTHDQKKYLDQLGRWYFIPRLGRFFSHPKVWARVLRYGFAGKFTLNAEELETASLVLFRYLTWQNVLQKVNMKHFVTHCDFGVPHIGRNIALNQAGVETWYFTDSMNFSGVNRTESEDKSHRHPWWTYLTYDHVVTWAQSIVDYFKGHPMTIGQYHIIGCLWSSLTPSLIPFSRRPETRLVIGIFDTGYNFNGIGDYEEGIAFTKDILRLAENFCDIQILFKSKFARGAFLNAGHIFGRQMHELYEQMAKHSRIQFLSSQTDPSDVIPLSDLVISFPFTSTTFEALSMNKLAIWHDPQGLYRATMYGRLSGVMSFSCEDLVARVRELKDNPEKLKEIPIADGSPLFDPYRDQKAIERFRELLVNVSGSEIDSKIINRETVGASTEKSS